MNNPKTKDKIFGPYNKFPRAYISHKDTKTLVRTVYEERKEEDKVEEPAEEMTWGKLMLYYLFLYTPESQKNHQPEPEEPRVLEEQVLCYAESFEVFKEDEKYFIKAFAKS